MSDTVCVIGSNSFSGAYFCKYLLEQGVNVIGLSRSPEPINPLLPHKWVNDRKVSFYQYDLNHHLSEIESLFDSEKPAHIYNFAAQSMVGQSWTYPEHWFNTNVVSSVKLHNMLRHKDFLDRYIHISTPEVYGSCSGFVHEDHPYNPSTPYAVSRAAADMSLKTFFDVHGFPVVTTRAANVYGEGQQLYRLIPKTILCVLTGNKLPLHGGGHSERAFIHMDDVSIATELVGQSGALGETYHISGEKTISIRNLVKMICDQMSVEFEQVSDVTEDRPGKDAAYLLDSQKLRGLNDWQDNVSLQDGIARTITWLKDNFEQLKHQPAEYIHKE